MPNILLLAMSMAVSSGGSLAQDSPQRPSTPAAVDSIPLFASHDVLTFTLRAPFETLFDDRSEEAEAHPATLSYETPDGETVTHRLKLELRGKTRRQARMCNFPPMRLDFPKDSVGGTLFATQNRLKLVTQCQVNREEYGQYVLLEYLIYRAFNLLTQYSFEVRLAEITYVYTDGDRESVTRPAFIIEDNDALAARTGWEVLKVPIIDPEYMDPDQLALVEIFQYMIGHLDWSAFEPEPGDDECCHNGEVVGSLQGFAFSIPYDFDFAGLVNARYAVAPERLGTRGDVRRRVYRGICREQEQLNYTLQQFNLIQQDIYGLFEQQEGLEDRQRRQALDYLEEFYDIINNAREVRNEFVRGCRRV